MLSELSLRLGIG